ncbi:MAG: M48 family metallopeptidase [Deltaproteobacteria bacterium]|nr:M48 family metallopeptidase [Deltaproteobacteria bacterium]
MMINVDELVRSKRRTIAIEVRRDASVIVRAPYRASDSLINHFVHEKSGWIARKQESARKRVSVKKRFVDGEEFLYIGRPYKLSLVDNGQQPLSFDGRFILSRDYAMEGRRHFIEWYRDEARRALPERVEHFAAAAGLSYQCVRITSALTRWGSCGVKGSLNFSWRIMMLPPHIIDSIVAHEVSHLAVRNHSQHFWRRVGELYPDYRSCDKWLRENDHHLTL